MKQTINSTQRIKIHNDKIIEGAHSCLNCFYLVNSSWLKKDIPWRLCSLKSLSVFSFTFSFKYVPKHTGPCSKFLRYFCP